MDIKNQISPLPAIELESLYFDDMTLREPWGETVLDIVYERGNVCNPDISTVDFYVMENDGYTLGQFDHTVSPNRIGLVDSGDGSVPIPTLLHEMIHYYEYALEDLNPALSELVLVKLWERVHKQVPDLEQRILDHLEVTSHAELEAEGGRHGLLFLLKSYDLDNRLGLPLGTVFGYGYAQNDEEE